MQISNTTDSEKKPVTETAEISIPSGLIGLPTLTKFALIGNEEILPFVILRNLGEEELDFMAVDPSVVLTSYKMDVPDADAEELGLTPSGKAPLVLNIAIIHPTEPKKITVNLKAPVIINRETGIGKQILLENCGSYSAEHELDIQAP